jgi:hypothetical protein
MHYLVLNFFTAMILGSLLEWLFYQPSTPPILGALISKLSAS